MELTTIDTNNYAAMAKADGHRKRRQMVSKQKAPLLVCVSITHLSWVRQK